MFLTIFEIFAINSLSKAKAYFRYEKWKSAFGVWVAPIWEPPFRHRKAFGGVLFDGSIFQKFPNAFFNEKLKIAKNTVKYKVF